MNAEIALRVVSGAAVLLLGRRMGRRAGAAALGALAAFAVLGPARATLPEVAECAALAGGLALLLALGTQRDFPSITEEAARTAALTAAGAAGVALVAGRRLAGGGAFVLAVLAFLAVSAGAAEACRAGGEAGWREGLARALGVAVPAALGAGLSAALASAGRAQAVWILLGGVAAGLLVWVPAVLAESSRVKAELSEEVRARPPAAGGRGRLALPVDPRLREALRARGRTSRVRAERASPRGRAPPAAPPNGRGGPPPPARGPDLSHAPASDAGRARGPFRPFRVGRVPRHPLRPKPRGTARGTARPRRSRGARLPA